MRRRIPVALSALCLTVMIAAGFSCEGGPLGENESKDDDDDDGALVCEEEKPDVGTCNTCTCTETGWSCTKKACDTEVGPCDWRVAESYPVQVSGECTYAAVEASPLVIDLATQKPGSDKITVKLDEEESLFETFTFNADENNISLTIDDKVGKALVVHVSYTGEGNVQVDSEACTAARTDFQALVQEIDALDKACATDDDCVAFGNDPRAACGGPSFTSAASFAAYSAQHAEASLAIEDACEVPNTVCAAAFPTTPHCDPDELVCVGQ